MSAIEELIDGSGTVASVYMRSPSAHADADHRYETRWKNARRSLADQGAPADVLEALDAVVAGTEHGEAAAFAIFGGRTGTLVERLNDDLRRDTTAVDSLPRLIPVLSSRQGTVPHVMVVTDRIGADIIGVTAGNVAERREVDGDTEHIHRGRFGGWSHRRFQQRAENTWESNAKLVAEEVCEVAHKIGARVVTVAGDDRASHLLYERLDTSTHAIAKLLDVGSADEIAAATVRAVADVVASDTADVLRYFADRTASRGSVNGVAGTLNALSVGRVATLLVHEDPDDERRAWFAPGGSPTCANHRSDQASVEGRLVDVAVRSALLTHAEIRVVPTTTIEDGMGAILRW